MNLDFLPSILDREINDKVKDKFGHKDYAKVLENIIESPMNRPPFSIGLLGSWGTGKSSIKAMYIHDLKESRIKDNKGRYRSEKIFVSTFNAWRYGGENIRRALLLDVFIKLGGSPKKLHKDLFNLTETNVPEPKSNNELRRNFFDTWLFTGFQLIIVLLVLILVTWVLTKILGFTHELSYALVILALSFFIPNMAKYFLDSSRFIVSRYSDTKYIQLPVTTIEQFEMLLQDQIKLFKEKNPKYQKIIVFVDDLDRLPSREMINGLDAIRSLMEIPILEVEDIGIIFVVSCDEKKIADALSKRDSRNIKEENNSNVSAYHYLDRIFQYRIEIPPFPKQDMRSFVLEKMQEEAPELVKDLYERGYQVTTLIDTMIHVGVQNPRRALQISNCFIQNWWLANRRENNGAGTNIAGGLQEGSVTSYPYALAAISVLQIDFPMFYKDLQREPGLLLCFRSVALRNKDIKEYPEALQIEISKYFEEKDCKKIKNDFRLLRQYIASTEAVKWPPSLQPMLLLSTDKVTRRYGDKARSIYDAIVSGDVQGLLASLGHEYDNHNLSEEDIRMIQSIEQDLFNESETIQDNAAAVIGNISHRIPDHLSVFLYTPLVKRLIQSHSLRCRVGINKITEIVNIVEPIERKDLANSLIDDLLVVNKKINFRNEAGEIPTLEEAKTIVNECCSLVLSIWSRDNLDSEYVEKTINWLVAREVKVTDKSSDIIPFTQLEYWTAQYESLLLPVMGYQYVSLLLEQLKENHSVIVQEDVLRRTRIVFNNLIVSGQENNDNLWELMRYFVELKEFSYVRFACQYLIENITRINDQAYTMFIEAFIKNIYDSSDIEGFDSEYIKNTLFALLNLRMKDLGPSAQLILAQYLDLLCEKEETTKDGLQILEILHEINPESIKETIKLWIDGLFTKLNNIQVEWLANNFQSRLDDELRKLIWDKITASIMNVNIGKEYFAALQILLESLPQEVYKEMLLQDTLIKICNYVKGVLNYPNYIENIMPIVIPYIKYTKPDIAGSLLSTLFTQLKGQLALYGNLHKLMTGYWPSQQEYVSHYNPQVIFNDAVNIAKNGPNQTYSWQILRSLNDLSKRIISSDNNVSTILQLAYIVWPYFKISSSKVMLAYKNTYSPDTVANLMTTIEAEKAEQHDSLKQVWSHFSTTMTIEERVVTSRAILTKPILKDENNPDLGVKLWFDAQTVDKEELLRNVILDVNINDENKRRIWTYITSVIQDLGKGFFESLLPELFKINDIPNTTHRVFQYKETINELYSTSEEKYKFGTGTLLKALSSATTHTDKNELALWVKSLNHGAIIRGIEKNNDLKPEDIAIFHELFPRSSVIERLLKKVSGND